MSAASERQVEDRQILTAQKSLGPLADGVGDVAHRLSAGVAPQHVLDQEDREAERGQADEEDEQHPHVHDDENLPAGKREGRRPRGNDGREGKTLGALLYVFAPWREI
jgi:hypothetical protein